MSVITITSRITKEEDVTEQYAVCKCKRHALKPNIVKVYTGKKHTFQGVVARCPGSDDCTVFQYTAEDAAKYWNQINFQ